MNWYNPKVVAKMIGVKRYQQKQSKRLSKPKDVTEVIDKWMSRLTRSFQKLDTKEYHLNRDGSVKSHEGTRRSQSKLEKNRDLINDRRENKLSQSFYGNLNKISASEKQFNPTYGEDDEVLYNTWHLKNQDNPSKCYLNTINGSKRSRAHNFSAGRINNTKEQSLNRLKKVQSEGSKLNDNEYQEG
jgi:hypothetical protein